MVCKDMVCWSELLWDGDLMLFGPWYCHTGELTNNDRGHWLQAVTMIQPSEIRTTGPTPAPSRHYDGEAEIVTTTWVDDAPSSSSFERIYHKPLVIGGGKWAARCHRTCRKVSC